MKLWQGRLTGDTDALAAKLNNSLAFDSRLAEVDIQGSIAWTGALLQAGVLTEEESRAIKSGLEKILREIRQGTFVLSEADEDIHTAVERQLTEMIGPLGGKLHTGRSRNDQVATDFRLWVKEALLRIDEDIKHLQQFYAIRQMPIWISLCRVTRICSRHSRSFSAIGGCRTSGFAA